MQLVCWDEGVGGAKDHGKELPRFCGGLLVPQSCALKDLGSRRKRESMVEGLSDNGDI